MRNLVKKQPKGLKVHNSVFQSMEFYNQASNWRKKWVFPEKEHSYLGVAEVEIR